MEKNETRKFAVGSHHGKLNILPSNYQFPPMTCFQLIANWLLESVSENLPPLWNLRSKKVKHINNSMRMWNMMKCFMSKVKRVYIDKVCWKAEMKYWDYMSAIKVWDNVQNGFNIKYMADSKQ